MTYTHPKVGIALLVRVRVKPQVWALARRDAHSFLAVWAVCWRNLFVPCGRLGRRVTPLRRPPFRPLVELRGMSWLLRFRLLRVAPGFAFSG